MRREGGIGKVQRAGAGLGPQRRLCEHVDDAGVRRVLAGSAADAVQAFEFACGPGASAEAAGAVEGLGLDALARLGLVRGRACAGDGVGVREVFCAEMDVAQASIIHVLGRCAGLPPVPAAEHVSEQVAVRHGHLDGDVLLGEARIHAVQPLATGPESVVREWRRSAQNAAAWLRACFRGRQRTHGAMRLVVVVGFRGHRAAGGEAAPRSYEAL